MKSLKKLLIVGVTCGLFLLNACKEEVVTPTTTETTYTSCQLLSTSSPNGDASTFTFDGTKLMKVVEKYQSGTDTYNYTYDGDKLTEINQGDYKYKVMYNGNTISKLEIYEDGDLISKVDITFNSAGKLQKAEVYDIDGTNEMLSETFTYTFSGDNCTNMVNSADTDDDGVLDTQYDVTFTFSAFDTSPNPYYNLPLYLTELENMMLLCKNNPSKGEILVLSEKTVVTATYTYNATKYPTQISGKTGNSAPSITNFTYTCK